MPAGRGCEVRGRRTACWRLLLGALLVILPACALPGWDSATADHQAGPAPTVSAVPFPTVPAGPGDASAEGSAPEPSDAPSSDAPPSDAPPSDAPPSDAPPSDPAPSGAALPDPSSTDPAHPATDPPADGVAGDGHGHDLPPGVSRPAWLGTRPLPLGPDGEALPQPTPEELVDRRIPTIDLLPPPAPGAPFAATISPLSDAVVTRSTWAPQCPVTREELRHVTVSFWGFDDRPHTGEMIVNASWAEEVTAIFGQLYDARYPIEEMRIVSAEELEGTPTGDGNDTTAFVCRPTRGSSSWSQHAYGLAVDINPFHNPYQRGDRILPELAGAYLDRSHDRPGMLAEGSTAVQAFDAIGWGWGGRWTSLIDWMHFSANGR